MKETKTIYVYKTSDGEEVCRVDLENKERPVKFSKRYMSLRNAGYEKIQVPVEKGNIKDKQKEVK